LRSGCVESRTAMLFRPQRLITPATDSEGMPVYMQDWFTGLIAQRSDVIRATVVRNNMAVGVYIVSPYQNPLGMKQAYNLPWARLGGPVIDENVDPARRSQIVKDLIDQLPNNRSYFLTLSNESDFNAFLAAGFEGELEENFVIPVEQATTWERGLSNMARRHLRRAREDLNVSTLDPAEFIRHYGEHLSLRRRKPYSELSIARDLLLEATRRGQARAIAARRPDSVEIEAAVACLWDSSRYFYWMTTRRPPVSGRKAPHQGAVKFLMYTAIKHAHAKGLTFDFDGAPSPRLAQLYAAMGGTKSVRYKVTRETACERLASLIRSPVKSALRRTIGRLIALKLN
jgi:Acetyltransferase (GNAT) domain